MDTVSLTLSPSGDLWALRAMTRNIEAWYLDQVGRISHGNPDFRRSAKAFLDEQLEEKFAQIRWFESHGFSFADYCDTP